MSSMPASEAARCASPPVRDFFVADLVDCSVKGDLASMEYPIFALKAGDRRVRVYQRNGVTVTVKPGYDGCATLHDKDVWLYCISQLVEAMNRDREGVCRVVRFTAYDFLVQTNRDTSGRAYERMGDALARLAGTQIETNIATDGQRERAGFGLLASWRVIERDDDRMVAVEVTLPEWLWRSVKACRVLTLSRDYFRLRKPLHRRIYELARKHCGGQPSWRISLATLWEKSGSTSPLRNFRCDVRQLADSGELPDYRVVFDSGRDVVMFYSAGMKGAEAHIADVLGSRPKGSLRPVCG